MRAFFMEPAMPNKPTPAQQLERAADMIRQLLRSASHHLPAGESKEAEDCEEQCRVAALDAAAAH